MDEFEEVQRELAASEDRIADVQAEGEQRRNRDRSFIVYTVVGLYAAAISLAVIYLLIRGWWSGSNVFDNLMEIVKVAILPILTLVIGYYFGTKDQSANHKG